MIPSIQESLLGGRFAELKRRLLFLLGAIVVFRIGTFIPVPGIDPRAMARLFQENQNTVLGFFNMFSGGAFKRVSLFALGIMPYISASIIVQLLTVVSPKLEELKKEGSAGRRKLNQYTRYGTLFLSLFQSLGISIALARQGVVAAENYGFLFYFLSVTTLTAGTMFLMWLGEQITERGIGNGISMLIFAGIASGLPGALAMAFEQTREGEINVVVMFLIAAIVMLVTGFVVFVERGQRRIAIHYAKRQQGGKLYMPQSSHLPLKINMSGVIPPIFASSILLFPATIGQWFGSTNTLTWLQDISLILSPGQPLHVFLYAIAIIFFAFFYTALVFNPKETADHLKKSGAFIPGMRPGEQTAKFVDTVLTRLTLFGALYVAFVCLLPEFLVIAWNVPFYFGGTSLLIVVVVVMDFMAQLQTYIMSYQYENLIKKSNILKSKSLPR